MNHILFIHLPAEGHFVSLQVFWIWAKLYKHSHTGFCVNISFKFLWENTCEWNTGYIVSLCLTLLKGESERGGREKCQIVIQSNWCYSFPPALNESSCCSASLPAFGVVSFILFYFSHCTRYIVVCNYGFNSSVSDDQWFRIFTYAYLPSRYLPWWNVCIFCPFLTELFGGLGWIVRVLCMYSRDQSFEGIFSNVQLVFSSS